MLAMSPKGLEFESPSHEIVSRGVQFKIKDMNKEINRQKGGSAANNPDNKFYLTQLEVGV
jgi:hypothetical protein